MGPNKRSKEWFIEQPSVYTNGKIPKIHLISVL